MISRNNKRRIRQLAADEWSRSFKDDQTPSHRRLTLLHGQARRKLAGKIADEFPSESLIGSLIAGLAIRFAFKLLEEWITNKAFTVNDINSYNHRNNKVQ